MIIKRKNKSKISGQEIKHSGEKKQSPETLLVKKTDSYNFPRTIIKERQEKRKGDRRRGYRRIDDRNLISRAHEEANSIKESASKEGFEYGITLYKEEFKKLNSAINELLTAKEKVMQESIPDIAILAVKVAEKIIKKELKLNDKIILDIVSEVIKSISKDETEIIIKTNENDTELVRKNIPEIYPYNEGKTRIIVMTDETVDRGSCIVETRSGVIDARFSTQLKILQKALEIGI